MINNLLHTGTPFMYSVDDGAADDLLNLDIDANAELNLDEDLNDFEDEA